MNDDIDNPDRLTEFQKKALKVLARIAVPLTGRFKLSRPRFVAESAEPTTATSLTDNGQVAFFRSLEDLSPESRPDSLRAAMESWSEQNVSLDVNALCYLEEPELNAIIRTTNRVLAQQPDIDRSPAPSPFSPNETVENFLFFKNTIFLAENNEALRISHIKARLDAQAQAGKPFIDEAAIGQLPLNERTIILEAIKKASQPDAPELHGVPTEFELPTPDWPDLPPPPTPTEITLGDEIGRGSRGVARLVQQAVPDSETPFDYVAKLALAGEDDALDWENRIYHQIQNAGYRHFPKTYGMRTVRQGDAPDKSALIVERVKGMTVGSFANEMQSQLQGGYITMEEYSLAAANISGDLVLKFAELGSFRFEHGDAYSENAMVDGKGDEKLIDPGIARQQGARPEEYWLLPSTSHPFTGVYPRDAFRMVGIMDAFYHRLFKIDPPAPQAMEDIFRELAYTSVLGSLVNLLERRNITRLAKRMFEEFPSVDQPYIEELDYWNISANAHIEDIKECLRETLPDWNFEELAPLTPEEVGPVRDEINARIQGVEEDIQEVIAKFTELYKHRPLTTHSRFLAIPYEMSANPGMDANYNFLIDTPDRARAKRIIQEIYALSVINKYEQPHSGNRSFTSKLIGDSISCDTDEDREDAINAAMDELEAHPDFQSMDGDACRAAIRRIIDRALALRDRLEHCMVYHLQEHREIDNPYAQANIIVAKTTIDALQNADKSDSTDFDSAIKAILDALELNDTEHVHHNRIFCSDLVSEFLHRNYHHLKAEFDALKEDAPERTDIDKFLAQQFPKLKADSPRYSFFKNLAIQANVFAPTESLSPAAQSDSDTQPESTLSLGSLEDRFPLEETKSADLLQRNRTNQLHALITGHPVTKENQPPLKAGDGQAAANRMPPRYASELHTISVCRQVFELATNETMRGGETERISEAKGRIAKKLREALPHFGDTCEQVIRLEPEALNHLETAYQSGEQQLRRLMQQLDNNADPEVAMEREEEIKGLRKTQNSLGFARDLVARMRSLTYDESLLAEAKLLAGDPERRQVFQGDVERKERQLTQRANRAATAHRLSMEMLALPEEQWNAQIKTAGDMAELLKWRKERLMPMRLERAKIAAFGMNKMLSILAQVETLPLPIPDGMEEHLLTLQRNKDELVRRSALLTSFLGLTEKVNKAWSAPAEQGDISELLNETREFNSNWTEIDAVCNLPEDALKAWTALEQIKLRDKHVAAMGAVDSIVQRAEIAIQQFARSLSQIKNDPTARFTMETQLQDAAKSFSEITAEFTNLDKGKGELFGVAGAVVFLRNNIVPYDLEPIKKHCRQLPTAPSDYPFFKQLLDALDATRSRYAQLIWLSLKAQSKRPSDWRAADADSRHVEAFAALEGAADVAKAMLIDQMSETGRLTAFFQSHVDRFGHALETLRGNLRRYEEYRQVDLLLKADESLAGCLAQLSTYGTDVTSAAQEEIRTLGEKLNKQRADLARVTEKFPHTDTAPLSEEAAKALTADVTTHSAIALDSEKETRVLIEKILKADLVRMTEEENALSRERVDLQGQVTTLQADAAELNRHLQDLQNVIASSDTQMDTLRTERDALRQERNRLVSDKQNLTIDSNRFQGRSDAFANANETLRNQVVDLKLQLANVTTQMEAADKRLAELQSSPAGGPITLGADFKDRTIMPTFYRLFTPAQRVAQKYTAQQGATRVMEEGANGLELGATHRNDITAKLDPTSTDPNIAAIWTILRQFDIQDSTKFYWLPDSLPRAAGSPAAPLKVPENSCVGFIPAGVRVGEPGASFLFWDGTCKQVLRVPAYRIPQQRQTYLQGQLAALAQSGNIGAAVRHGAFQCLGRDEPPRTSVLEKIASVRRPW